MTSSAWGKGTLPLINGARMMANNRPPIIQIRLSVTGLLVSAIIQKLAKP